MDTLFRLVNFQHHQTDPDPSSLNSTTSITTSSSSRSSRQNYPHHKIYYHQEEEECFNYFMDEEDLSSSSSKHYYPYNQPHHHASTTTLTTSTTTNTDFSFSPPTPPDLNFDFSGTWAPHILVETARAIADKNSTRVHQLLWMLNELSTPYGDTNQKLAAYFLQALFSRITDAGDRTYRTLASASDKTCSFESTRKTVLKFQEVSPWTTFGHVASNGAIMEALEGEPNLHIIDISNTYCTQWPTLLEALATRSDDTPNLRLTTVVTTRAGGSGAAVQRVMKEIGDDKARRKILNTHNFFFLELLVKLCGIIIRFNFWTHE